MKSFSKQYEIFFAVIIFSFLIGFGYFLFLSTPLPVFLLSKSNYINAKINYEKKVAQKNNLKEIMAQLNHWQQSHPQYFKTISTEHNHRDISEQLATAFQQSHFQITHIINNSKTNTITIESTGNYSDLLMLLAQLNLKALPVRIAQLQIDHLNHFSIQLMRDAHVKK